MSKCKCYIKLGKGDVCEIVQCPLCKAAPQLLETCRVMLQEIEDNNYRSYGIDPGADNETGGAKLGRATIEAAES